MSMLWLFSAGVASGFLNVVAGGGSMFTVPVMLFMGLSGPMANGTNRIAILAQSVVAVWTFFRAGYRNLRLSLTLALASLPGALLGAAAGTRLEGEDFDRVLAVVMLGSLVLMAFEGRTASRGGRYPPARWRSIAGHLGMVVVGLWGGFIQIGVGFIIMPILHRVMGLDLVHTNLHKVFIVMVFTLGAMAVFQSQAQILWSLGLVLAAGNALGGWLGARFAAGRGQRYIRAIFGVVIVAFIAQLLLR
jgi:uncharacterized membrane protein YfcA